MVPWRNKKHGRLSAFHWLAPQIRAEGSTNLVVSFTITNATPLNLGLAGFTADLMTGGEDYGDTNLQRCANLLSPGWLRFPGGTAGGAFDRPGAAINEI